MNEKLKAYKVENNLMLNSFYKKEITSKEINHRKFYNHVKMNANYGLNIKPAHFLDVLEAKKYLNIFQLNYSEEEIKKKYQSAWGNTVDYYSRLNCFIGLFDENKLIKYCSLNTGNLGLKLRSFGGSGSIYLILDKKYIENLNKQNKAFALKTFSLEFFSSENEFLEDEFSSSVSGILTIPELSVKKHYHNIHNFSEKDFPDLIAGKNPETDKSDAIEILVYSDILIEHIKEFRMSRRYYTNVKGIDFIEASQSRATRKIILANIEEKCTENDIKMTLV